MAAPWRYRVTVNSLAITRLTLPGGDVWRWARDVGRETMFEAIRRAPSRTGYMKAMHGFTTTPVGARHVQYTVHNDAPYAKFVHGGTTGPIRSTRPGGMLLVRPSPYSYFNRFVPLPSVDGQPAKPWLREASDAVLARHQIH